MYSDNSTILLVEDEPTDVFLTQRAFHKAKISHPLQVVEDGDAAIDYLSGNGDYGNREQYPLPILILLDLKLPRCSGLEVLEWLKQQPHLKRLPVVVLTSSNITDDVNQAYDLGVNSYIVKPVGFNHLLTVISCINEYWLVLNEKPEIF
ncbi:MAG: response regulator [Scytonema sp. PMC 1069.18]|nr:response regulator [Scytonema sp. PMC 1069.18]MEC4881892.1 response regulator [Scytonema sp. PMC 1070.18]